MSGPKCYEYESSYEPVYEATADIVTESSPLVREPSIPRNEQIEISLQRIACRLKADVPRLFKMHVESMLRTPAVQRDCLREWESTKDENVFVRQVELSEEAKERIRASGVVQLDMVRQRFDVHYDLRNHEVYVGAQTVMTERVNSTIAAERRRTLNDAVVETLQQEVLRVCNNLESEFIEQSLLRVLKRRGAPVVCTESSSTQRVYSITRPA